MMMYFLLSTFTSKATFKPMEQTISTITNIIYLFLNSNFAILQVQAKRERTKENGWKMYVYFIMKNIAGILKFFL